MGKKNALAKYKNQDLSYIDKKWVVAEYYHNKINYYVGRVIYDRYPKASIHLLFLPMISKIGKYNFPMKYKDFDMKYYKYLKFYHDKARELVKDLKNSQFKNKDNVIINSSNFDYIIGYHKNPSMIDLHIHIISTDIYESYVKSFTDTKYFISIDEVEQELLKNNINNNEIKYESINNIYNNNIKNDLLITSSSSSTSSTSSISILKELINDEKNIYVDDITNNIKEDITSKEEIILKEE